MTIMREFAMKILVTVGLKDFRTELESPRKENEDYYLIGMEKTMPRNRSNDTDNPRVFFDR